MTDIKLQEVFDNVQIPVYQKSQFTSALFPVGTNTINRKYFNCIPVLSKDNLGGDQAEIWLQKRQGIQYFGPDLNGILGAITSSCVYNIVMTRLTDIFVCAIYDITNSKFVIIQYRVNAGTSTKIGELTGVGATDQVFLSELNIGNVPYLGVVYHTANCSNSKGYYAASAAGVFGAASLTAIADADFPSNLGTPDHITGPMVQLNGTTYVLGKTGTIYNSDLNSITSWNALGLIVANQYPDQGVALCRYKHHVVCFKENSIEFFNDVGNPAPGSPLQRTEQAFIKFGALAPQSVINIDDQLYWIGRSDTGTLGLWRLEQYQPVKKSHQDEDAIINFASINLSGACNLLKLWPLMVNNTKNIIITGYPTNADNGLGLMNGLTFTGDTNSLTFVDAIGGQLCFNIDSQEFWLFRAGFDTINQAGFFPMCAANYIGDNSSPNTQYFPGASVYVSGSSNYGRYILGFPGTLSNANLQGGDFSDSVTESAITCGFQLNTQTFGNERRKRIHKLKLIMRIIGTAATPTATLWLVWNKTDYNNTMTNFPYPNPTSLRSLAIPNATGRYYLPNLGLARQWVFGVISKSKLSMAFQKLEIDISQGTN